MSFFPLTNSEFAYGLDGSRQGIRPHLPTGMSSLKRQSTESTACASSSTRSLLSELADELDPEYQSNHLQTSPTMFNGTGGGVFNDTQGISNGQGKKTTGPAHNSKYKAKLCKNWVQRGICPYYEKCQFAHGEHEIEKWSSRRHKLEQPPLITAGNNNNTFAPSVLDMRQRELEQQMLRERAYLNTLLRDFERRHPGRPVTQMDVAQMMAYVKLKCRNDMSVVMNTAQMNVTRSAMSLEDMLLESSFGCSQKPKTPMQRSMTDGQFNVGMDSYVNYSSDHPSRSTIASGSSFSDECEDSFERDQDLFRDLNSVFENGFQF